MIVDTTNLIVMNKNIYKYIKYTYDYILDIKLINYTHLYYCNYIIHIVKINSILCLQNL